MIMNCRKCNSSKCVKNGHHHGAQRYKCKDCGYQFTAGYTGKSDIAKSLAITLYLAGIPYKTVSSYIKHGSHEGILNLVRDHRFPVRKSDPEITKEEWHKKRYSFEKYMYEEWRRLQANRKETNELQKKYCIPYDGGRMPSERDRSFVRGMETVIDYMRANNNGSKRFVVIELHKYSGEVQKVAITP